MDNFKDFEDCLQDRCAEKVSANYIITRNFVISFLLPNKIINRLRLERLQGVGFQSYRKRRMSFVSDEDCDQAAKMSFNCVIPVSLISVVR